MSRLVAALVAASILVLGAVLAAGCGSEDVEKVAGVDVAQAAKKTAEKGTAKMDMTISITGGGVPQPVSLKASGVTALDRPAARMTIDFGPVAQSFGVPIPTDAAKIEMLFEGSRFNAKVPAIPGLPSLPGNAGWVQVDVAKIAEAAGFDTKGIGALFSIDPFKQLEILDSIDTLEKVGEEEVVGARTTHYRGTYTPQDYIDALPADQKRSVEEALRQAEGLTGTKDALGLDDPVPADLWIDDEGIARKITSKASIPSQGGVPGGAIEQEYLLSDFGAKLDTTAPPKDDTYEATDALSGLLKQGLSSMAGGPATQIG